MSTACRKDVIFEMYEKSITETSILYDISMIIGINDLDSIVEMVMERSTRTLCSEMAAVVLKDEQGGLKTRKSLGVMPQELDKIVEGKYAPLFAALNDGKENSYKLLQESDETEIAGTRYKCILIKALRAQDSILGFLVAGRLWKDIYDDEELRLFSVLTQRASVSFDNIKLREELLIQNITDPLTGLYNYRHMNRELPALLNEASDNGKSILIAFIDFLNFKTINDKLGHKVGDYVLAEFARFIKANFRKNDKCFRIGGDEFVIVFYDCPFIETVNIKKKLKSFSRSQSLQFIKKKQIYIDIDIGFSGFPDDAADFETLLRIADQRMYKEKKANKETLKASERHGI